MEISPNNLSSKPEIDVRIAHSDPWIGDSSRTSRRIFLDSDSSTLEQIYAKRDDARDDDDHDAHGNGSSDVSTGVNGSGDGTVAGDGPRGVFVKRITSGVVRISLLPHSASLIAHTRPAKGLLPLTVYVIHVTTD